MKHYKMNRFTLCVCVCVCFHGLTLIKGLMTSGEMGIKHSTGFYT